jgi:hypothetical protein
MFHLAATGTALSVAARASSSKVVAGMRKTMVSARKCRVPAIGVMGEASLPELPESSPNGQIASELVSEIVSMPEPHDLSPRASVPDAVPRAESGASLQITMPVGWFVSLSVSLFVSFNGILNFVVCIRCS